MNRRLPTAVLLGSVGSLSCLLAACSASTDVSLTGNTPSQYSHVWITVQEVDFNANANAGPSDSGWQAFPLSTPSTVDLVALNGGNLGEIASGLRIQAGTYAQVRLVPVDASAPLAASAQSAGALYNSEADYVDSSGTTHQLPLELLNPVGGLEIATSLKVPFGNIGAALAGSGIGGGANTTTTEVTPTATQGTFASSADTTTTTSGGLGVGSTGFGSTSNQTPNSYVVFFDGTSDLVPFNYGPAATSCNAAGGATAVQCVGIVLSQHASAYDLSQSGGISGQLTLTNITTSTSGLPAIQVSAQTLSADGTRHVVVSSTAVQADGSFLLYPLAASTNGDFYDVVIHGPGIATIIIKSVEVTLPSSSNSFLSPSSTTTTSNTGVFGTTTGTTATGTTNTTGTASTTGTTTTGSTGTANSTANNVVAIGTLTPRAATPYTATVSTSAASPLPAGAIVQFYETVARQGEVPYVVETSTLDPFNQDLFTPQALSTATIDTGTWSTSGGSVTIVSAAPAEGVGTYRVAASAPSFNGGSLTVQVSAPASSTTSTSTPAVPVVVPGLTLSSGSSGTVSATVTPATPGKYDQGQLLLSYNGTLVATASLNAVIAQGGTVSVAGVPAQTASSVYYATVRAWNSSDPSPPSSADPSGTLQVQSYPTAIDLSGSASGSIQLTVN
jgi:hypothetical protein